MIDNIYIGTILCIVIALGVYFYLRANKSKSQNSIEESSENKIRVKLEALEQDFIKKSINYYLLVLLNDSKLPKDEQEALIQKYNQNNEKILSEPRVKWDNFKIVGEEGNALDKILEEKVKDFSEKDDYTLSDSFNFMLLEVAKEEARKIIKNKEQN